VVRPTYKDGGYYQLPGGGAHEGEPDWEATRREVKEETGLEVKAGWLLVKDWMPYNEATGHAAGHNFVRYCGTYPVDFPDGAKITLPIADAEGNRELDDYRWLDSAEADRYCAPTRPDAYAQPSPPSSTAPWPNSNAVNASTGRRRR